MDCLGKNVESETHRLKRALKIIGVVVLCILLVLVRAYEDVLFYDPLLEYFKMDYKQLPLPEMDFTQLLGGVFLRFLLNTILSLCILWIVFMDKDILKLSLFLYAVLFVVLFAAFSFLVYADGMVDNQLLLFYVRRFLIQPIFLLILLPAFYFQKYRFR